MKPVGNAGPRAMEMKVRSREESAFTTPWTSYLRLEGDRVLMRPLVNRTKQPPRRSHVLDYGYNGAVRVQSIP